MKIPLSDTLDSDAIIKSFHDAKVLGIENFVTTVSDIENRFVSLAKKNVSVADNIDCEVKLYTLNHNQLTTVDNPRDRGQVQHMIVTRSSSFANPCTAFAWQYDSQGKIQLLAQLLGSPTDAVKLTVIAYF